MNGIKNNKIVMFFLFIATLLMLRIDLFLVSNENTKMNLLRYFVILVGIVSAILVKSKLEKKAYRVASKYNVIVFITTLFFFIYTKFLYSYDWYQVFSLSIPFWFCFYSVPIAYYFCENSKEKNSFIDKLMFMSLCFIIVRFMSWLLYNYTSINFLENFALEYPGWMRDGLQRVTGGQLLNITFVYYLYATLRNSKDKLVIRIGNHKLNTNFLVILFLIMYEIVVSQFRYTSCAMIVTCLASYYFTRKKAETKLGVILLILFSVLVLIVGGFFDSVLQTMSLDGKYGLSTLARLEGFGHFSNLFSTIGHRIGLGFVTNGYGTEDLFYRTSWLNYYISDLGIVGAFFRYGIFTVGIYGYLFYHLIKTSIISIKLKSEYKYLMIPMAVFVILNGLYTDIYDQSGAFAVPFYVGIVSIVSFQLTKNNDY